MDCVFNTDIVAAAKSYGNLKRFLVELVLEHVAKKVRHVGYHRTGLGGWCMVYAFRLCWIGASAWEEIYAWCRGREGGRKGGKEDAGGVGKVQRRVG